MAAEVKRTDGARYQPRLHDLRHAMATHCLVGWYRQGRDIQLLLSPAFGLSGTRRHRWHPEIPDADPGVARASQRAFRPLRLGKGPMNDRGGPWVRRFLVEYLIGERNYSLHTQQSRRDTFVLFLALCGQALPVRTGSVAVEPRSTPKLVREFVRHLEQVRHCSPSTINQRVISLRAWARFVGINSPEHLEWSSQMLTLHLKKHAPAPMNYLEKEEMKALLAAPDQRQRQGFRDYVLLLFLYNTGARASEASRLTVGDLDWLSPVATLHGKGRKSRQCPLWKVTALVSCESWWTRRPSASGRSFLTGRAGVDPLRNPHLWSSVRPAGLP